ncbi:hypothetical protein [Marinomonas piezotolerans]|nr:hypothetical protein [Marinomonas piezotolerans]
MAILRVMALSVFLLVGGCATSPNEANTPSNEPKVEQTNDRQSDSEGKDAESGSGVSAVALGGVIQMLFLLL